MRGSVVKTARTGNYEIAKDLAKADKTGLGFEDVDEEGDNLLHSLATGNRSEGMGILHVIPDLTIKRLSRSKNKKGATPVATAVRAHNSHLIGYLNMRVDPDINVTDANGETPLMIAARAKDIELVKLLLGNSLRSHYIPELQYSDGLTIVHLAVANWDIEHLKILLAHKANPNSRDSEGRTPLMYALPKVANPKAKDIIRLLRAHGAILNAYDNFGRSVKDYATADRSNTLSNAQPES